MAGKVVLQVPMTEEMRAAFECYARDMGFDSGQAYVRFLAKAAADKRQVDLDVRKSGVAVDESEGQDIKELYQAAAEAKQGLNLSVTYDPGQAYRHLYKI